MEREKALALWDAIFGNDVKWHVDCFGTWTPRYVDRWTKSNPNVSFFMEK